MTKRKLAILGSTGSIGRQALDIVSRHPDRFEVTALSAHNRAEELFDQVRRFRPTMAALTAGEVRLPEDVRFCDWTFGADALEQLAHHAPCDDVLVSVVGMVGLKSVLSARKAGKRVLLANKEALVAGGHLVMEACPDENGSPTLIPVDSEHSAIYQCLQAAKGNPFVHIILTASGGPFRTWPAEQIANAGIKDALKHPNWVMGQKITIDSASMFNKGLEMIEAKWLFHARPEQIQVLVHPQSIVHSMVAFLDGAVLAQMGVPDMRAPIAYALAYPDRISNGSAALCLHQLGTLTFEAPDETRFPALRLAREAMQAQGAAGCVFNAANEVAVDAFLQGRIAFGAIAHAVEGTLSRAGSLPANTLDEVLDADRQARGITLNLIS